MYCPLALRRTLAPLHCGLPPSCTVTRSFFFWPKCRGGGGGGKLQSPMQFCCFLLFFWSACEGNAPIHFSLVCVRVFVLGVTLGRRYGRGFVDLRRSLSFNPRILPGRNAFPRQLQKKSGGTPQCTFIVVLFAFTLGRCQGLS